MEFRELTEVESQILKHNPELSRMHVNLFNDTYSFMNTWVQYRAPQWANIKENDLVKLSTKTNNSMYYVHSIDLANDEIQFRTSLKENARIFPPREISSMPFAEKQ